MIQNICLKGIRVNNLKNISLELPRNKFIIVTGVSGSGKSSLAFDTLYAEGQRRYVESLSSYARQFLTRMAKPECDYIKGLPPAIAIEQKVNTRNPRSTVGTSSEVYDYLRMLFARIGHTYSPVSGCMVTKDEVDDICKKVLSYPFGTKIAVLIDIIPSDNRTIEEQLSVYMKEGFSRLECDGDFFQIADLLQDTTTLSSNYRLLIDRLTVSNDELSRLTDSIETAYFEGHNRCIVKFWQTDGSIVEQSFSKEFTADGIVFCEPSDLMFNFNNPYGACPKCEGFGMIVGVDEDLVIPDKTRSIYEDAVMCWRSATMSVWKDELIRLSGDINFPIHTPYCDLSEKDKQILWHGNGFWQGIDGFFKMIDENSYKIQYRVMKARYRGKTICSECNGTRLRKDAEYVKIAGKSISEIVCMPISKLQNFFKELELSSTEQKIAKRLLIEINNRLQFLNNVGLGYLTLNRLSSTLSGGESQRINIATSLGSSLVGSLYILDEPSIGLHSRDTERLISVLRKLQQLGNTVVVVEHDEDMICEADYIVDIGPDAGRCGGEIIFAGNLDEALNNGYNKNFKSYTLDYLTGKRTIDYNHNRRPWKKFIDIEGAQENNLKGINVRFPLEVMTVVTGVSGSGKSTLVRNILYRSLLRKFGEQTEAPGIHKKLSGCLDAISGVEFVNQQPIGTSSRSNAATYLKAFDEIRKLFADQQSAKQMGFTAGYFSFNAEGGRCEECKGEGTITIPMQFMSDITIECDACHGMRYKKDLLDIKYRNKNIYDILNMTVNQAIDFFSEQLNSIEKKIVARLRPLQDVGLGYIKLGQSSSTLSGGESQRIKLAYFLSLENSSPKMFIFDEPTTGLHFHDISILLKAFDKLIDKGNSVIIIEHNLDVIKSADWIIDIGPEGGNDGGQIVFCGTPENIIKCDRSYTGKFLKKKLICK